MISVGIHDNLRVYKAAKNDRGSLIIGYKEEKAGNISILDMLNSASDNSSGGGKENDFLIYALEVADQQGNPFTAEKILQNITELKDMLTHILLNYMTSEKVQWNVMKDCGITPENITTQVTQQPVLTKIYANLVDQFIAMMTPHLTNTNKLFRCLFVRQSKNKHFAALRRRFLDAQPFMEPMSVPKEQSRLHYTKWEIANGFNSGEKTQADLPVGDAALTAQLFNINV